MADRWQSQGSGRGAAAPDVGNGGEGQQAEERQGGRYYGRARSRRERRSRSWGGERGGSRGRGWREGQAGRVELGGGPEHGRPFGGSESGNREYGPGSYGRDEYGQGQGGFNRGQGAYGQSPDDYPESRAGFGESRGGDPGSRGGYGSGLGFRAGTRQGLADRPGREYGSPEHVFHGGGWEGGRGGQFGETGRGRAGGGWGDAEGREETTGRWRGAWGASPWAGWSGPDLSAGYGAEGVVESGRQTARRQGRWQREALTAGEIMTRGIKAVTKQSTLNNVAQVMKDENCGIVPVVDESHKLLGVVTDRDIVVRALAADGGTAQTTVESVMTDDVDAVAPDDEVRDVIELMGQKQIRRVPVVDRNDRLVGIIAMADIANRADYDEDLQDALERISSRRSFWNRLWS